MITEFRVEGCKNGDENIAYSDEIGVFSTTCPADWGQSEEITLLAFRDQLYDWRYS